MGLLSSGLAGGMAGGGAFAAGTGGWGALALGLMAAAGSEMKSREQKKAFERKRKLAAETARYRPWTGLTPDTNFQEPSWMGNAMKYGATGAMMGQNIQAAQQNQKLKDSLVKLNQAKTDEILANSMTDAQNTELMDMFNAPAPAPTAAPVPTGTGSGGGGWLSMNPQVGYVPPTAGMTNMYQNNQSKPGQDLLRWMYK